jgi:hypothetical protein
LSVLVVARHLEGQVPFGACRDRDDRPIPAVVDNTMADAGEAVERDGHPIILWNARDNARLSQTEQIFIYLHECAHHVLGHLYHRGTEARDELEADCWAIELMVDEGIIKSRHLAVLERSRETVRGDETHLGGEAHVRSLEQCLSTRTDAKAWAAALDTVVVAARDSFGTRRGRLLDAMSTPQVYEALLDVPGTYDCEIVGAAFRCTVFAARTAGPAEGRYHRLLKILRGWLPAGWTATERAGEDGTNRTFLAQEDRTGTLLTLALTGARVYLLVKRVPVLPALRL